MPSVLNQRQQHSAERREQVLAAATEVFGAEGFRAARVDDIAARAGVSKGLVYVFFKHKRGLFDAALKQELLEWMQATAQFAAGSDNPLLGLERLFTGVFSVLQDKPLLKAALAGDPSELGRYLPVLRRLNGRRRRQVVALLEEGVSSGVFRPGLDVLCTADILDSLHRSYILRALEAPHDPQFGDLVFDDAYVKQLGDFIACAVKA